VLNFTRSSVKSNSSMMVRAVGGTHVHMAEVSARYLYDTGSSVFGSYLN
jgi:hypothetical protein